MRGRSQVKITNMNKDSLNLENVDKDMFEGAVSRVDWLKESASNHTTLGNKLSNIAKRMMASERIKEDTARREKNSNTNEKTMGNYMQLAETVARKQNLTEHKRKLIKDNVKKKMKKRKGKEVSTAP